jgi:hypothetical protein
MDGQGQGSAAPPGSLPAAGVVPDSLLKELKDFAGRLASFGLGEETGRLLKDARVKRPAPAKTARSAGEKP